MFCALLIASIFFLEPLPKTPNEPEWMANFLKVYGLKEGQFVKRIHSPYCAERVDFIIDHPNMGREKSAESRKYFQDHSKMQMVFAEQVGLKIKRKKVMSFRNPLNINSDQTMFSIPCAIELITGLKNPAYQIDPAFQRDFLFDGFNCTVEGDFIVRKDAPIEKLTEQLESIFRNECHLPVKMRVDFEEQDVYVATGDFKIKQLEWRKKIPAVNGETIIDIYSSVNTSNTLPGTVAPNQQYGNPVDFVRFVGNRIETRIVWDQNLPDSPEFFWVDHQFGFANPLLRADDRDPEKILKNVSAQTGLTFKKEKRKVAVLMISRSELK